MDANGKKFYVRSLYSMLHPKWVLFFLYSVTLWAHGWLTGEATNDLGAHHDDGLGER